MIARLVEVFSRPGGCVLDPFAGSGVTVVEAARLGRRAVGVELSGVAARLGRLLLDPPSSDAFERAASAIVRDLAPEAGDLYATEHAACRARVTARGFVWSEDGLEAVEGVCPRCDVPFAQPPAAADLERARRSPVILPHPDAPVPQVWQMKKLHRAGLTRMAELFTPRNRALLARLRAEITSRPLERGVREALWLTFTANLAQCSRMIADYRGRAGGPSWKVNSYWLPKRARELNVLAYFENRAEKTRRALVDLAAVPSRGLGAIVQGDARRLDIENASVDYVLTDPPYGGEGIQYGELSFLWNLWLGEPIELEREIAFNPGRAKSLGDYAEDLGAVFSECRRVLRPRAFMTVAFANSDPGVWAVLEAACRGAGFELVAETAIRRSAPGLTERVAARATKGDQLLHYRAR